MLEDLRTLVADLVRDDAGRISPGQLDRAIAAGVAQYNKDRPRRCVEDVVAEGGSRLEVPDGANRVVAVEAPAGIVPPIMLPGSTWGHYHAPEALYLLLTRPLAAGTPVRLTLTRPHLLTNEADSIPEADREALASYAAAVLFDQVSAATSGDSNPSIPADAVNHASKPESFAKRAERLRQRYYDLLGIDAKRVQPASSMASHAPGAGHGGPRLTHSRRRRP